MTYVTPYIDDPDVYAARMLVREITGDESAELLPGYQGCNFCPIAVSLARFSEIENDLDYDKLKADPEGYSEAQGGYSALWEVGSGRILIPASGDHWIDLVNNELSGEEIIELENGTHAAYEGRCFELSYSAEYLREAIPISYDAWGPGAGNPSEFIRRFDEGEFPLLRLEGK